MINQDDIDVTDISTPSTDGNKTNIGDIANTNTDTGTNSEYTIENTDNTDSMDNINGILT